MLPRERPNDEEDQRRGKARHSQSQPSPSSQASKAHAVTSPAMPERRAVRVNFSRRGGTYSNSAHVVALNGEQLGSGYPGPYCGKEIRIITANGKTYNANIVDKCSGCPYAGLDLTEGLFSEFSSPSAGLLTGSWDYV
ncbi:hypothetical protein ACEPAG_4734 [Sanghuangporus baumii]